MRKLFAVAVVALAGWAIADEFNENGTTIQGTGVQVASGLNENQKYAIQCINTDGGLGQQVYYRPGGCSGCVVDAGPGDVLIDFRTNTDPYVAVLRSRMNSINLRAYTQTDALYCIVAPKTP